MKTANKPQRPIGPKHSKSVFRWFIPETLPTPLLLTKSTSFFFVASLRNLTSLNLI